MSDTPLISVVIPVKNGDAWLDKTLPAIFSQTLADRMEVIVVDSGSTDRTNEILAKYPVKVIRIDPSTFNHGTTRNLGVQHARGQYIAMTVQDATPDSPQWLQHLLDGFEDATIAGVCGQQIVDHDPEKNPVDWFRPISAPGKVKYQFDNTQSFSRLSPEEQRRYCHWDNVNAMYRRDILLQLPFRKTSFSEDGLWSRDALLAGYAIVYNTAARVQHYHHETVDYAFRRSFTEYYHSYKYFGTRPSPVNNGVVAFLRNIKLLLKERKIRWADKWKWLRFNYAYRKAINASTTAFNEALEKGPEELERQHTLICKTPPQALKPGSAKK